MKHIKLFENFDKVNENTDLEDKKEEAKKISIDEECVQHVNEVRPGVYKIEDWFDSDQTVASYENGNKIN
jgi:hypothetical protein